MAPGTIRNLVWKKELVENVHYIKPTPRKLLFLWSRIEQWLLGSKAQTCIGRSTGSANQGLINI